MNRSSYNMARYGQRPENALKRANGKSISDLVNHVALFYLFRNYYPVVPSKILEKLFLFAKSVNCNNRVDTFKSLKLSWSNRKILIGEHNLSGYKYVWCGCFTEFMDLDKPARALDTLQEVFRNKKWAYNWSESVLEPIMFKYLELCVDLRKSHIAKEGLFQYRNMFQSVNVGSLEQVIRLVQSI